MSVTDASKGAPALIFAIVSERGHCTLVQKGMDWEAALTRSFVLLLDLRSKDPHVTTALWYKREWIGTL